MDIAGAYKELEWPEERHVVFNDDFSDGYLTVMEICVQCQGNRHTCVHIDRSGFGSVPTEEMPDMSEDAFEIVEDQDAIPEFISNDTPTAPYKIKDVVRNPLGEYEANPFADSPTLVEEVQVIASNDNDESEAA